MALDFQRISEAVGGHAHCAHTALTVDTGVYAASDILTTVPIEITKALGARRRGVLLSIVLTDESKQDANLDLIFFSSTPAATTAANSAEAFADADAPKVLGIVQIADTDYVDLANFSVATKSAIGLGLFNDDSTTPDSIWMAIRVNTDTPTYGAAGDVYLRLYIGQE